MKRLLLLLIFMNIGCDNGSIHRDAELINVNGYSVSRSTYEPWRLMTIDGELIDQYGMHGGDFIGKSKDLYFLFNKYLFYSTTNVALFKKKAGLDISQDITHYLKPFKYFVENVYRNIFFRWSRRNRINMLEIPSKMKYPYLDAPFTGNGKKINIILDDIIGFHCSGDFIYGIFGENDYSHSYFIYSCSTGKMGKYSDLIIFKDLLRKHRLRYENIVVYPMAQYWQFINNSYRSSVNTFLGFPHGRLLADSFWVLRLSNRTTLAFKITKLNKSGNIYYGWSLSGGFILEPFKGVFYTFWDKRKFERELRRRKLSTTLKPVHQGSGEDRWKVPPKVMIFL